MTKNIFNFNHISNDLTEDEISELKALYKCYHRLFKCYQWLSCGSCYSKPNSHRVAGPGVLIQGYLTKSDKCG